MSLAALSRKKELRVVGVMNGTSLDGIDYVYCKIENSRKTKISFLDQEHFSFPDPIRQQLVKAANHTLNVAELSDLHHELGRLYQAQFKKIIAKRNWKVDAIGLHGQTVYHAPPKATLQIGEPSYLATQAGVPVISDFRTADLAAGGQGAPIASLFHRVVFQAQFPNQVISVHNLGGISNLSFINKKGDVEKAFDTGPANMLMDLFISKVSHGELSYDKSGKFASKGIPVQKYVEDLLSSDPFFNQKPPKSCGREQYGDSFLQKLENHLGPMLPEDKMATLAELTARSISDAYNRYCSSIPKAIILCGGGALNPYLQKRIQYHLPKSQVMTTEDFGWPVSSIEGAAFALLAAYRIWEKTANLPKTTGAKKAVFLGKITEAY
ncbi:MAG: anhydro-N-acetylmuramic acid kinase [Pseudobdellovibrionaceae bacterium]